MSDPTEPMPSRDLLLLDTITAIDASCAGAVIVSGSHGGVSSSGFVERAAVHPHEVFFNDAGDGYENGVLTHARTQAPAGPVSGRATACATRCGSRAPGEAR